MAIGNVQSGLHFWPSRNLGNCCLISFNQKILIVWTGLRVCQDLDSMLTIWNQWLIVKECVSHIPKVLPIHKSPSFSLALPLWYFFLQIETFARFYRLQIVVACFAPSREYCTVEPWDTIEMLPIRVRKWIDMNSAISKKKGGSSPLLPYIFSLEQLHDDFYIKVTCPEELFYTSL